jgi:hypothetical protein
MNEYTVTLRLNNREQFMNFVETIGPAVERLVVTVQTDEQVPAPNTGAMPRAQTRHEVKKVRTPRGSKVNDIILQALSSGSNTIKELKGALEAAELSPGSLSTGLAALQRSKQVERVGDGLYRLAMAEAA